MFSQSVIEQLKYYVYFLRDPRNGQVFYVGKGIGNRVFNHVSGALESSTETDKLERIRAIQSSGLNVQHFILRHGLEETVAFEVEAALIDFIGMDNLTNLQGGHYSSDYGLMTTDEIIAMYQAADLETTAPVMLININKRYQRDMTEDELYDATRKAWVLGERRNSAKYAVATYRGLTREVYLIESWFKVPESGDKRWGFNGRVAPDSIRQELRHKSVKSLYKQGEANPIKYLNCVEQTPPLALKEVSNIAEAENDGSDFHTPEAVILVRINKQYRPDMTADELYEATRKSWVVGERRNSARFAIPVYKGITLEAYSIHHWFHAPEHGQNRWGFEGEIADEQTRSTLRNKNVKLLFKRGEASPVKYINC